MFVSNKTHFRALEDLARERGRRETLERGEAVHHSLVSFLCARVNHLERTNAVMFQRLTQLNVPIPTLNASAVPLPTSAPPTEAIDEAFRSLGGSMFEDMGDEAAKKAGVGWSHEGTADADLAVPKGTR